MMKGQLKMTIGELIDHVIYVSKSKAQSANFSDQGKDQLKADF